MTLSDGNFPNDYNDVDCTHYHNIGNSNNDNNDNNRDL